MTVRPFLKWAGGKSRLIAQLGHLFPPELSQGKIQRYVEPFVGGGAMFLHIANHYPHVQEFVIADINEALMACYMTIRHDVDAVIERLACMRGQYAQADHDARKRLFYAIRAQFNAQEPVTDIASFDASWVEHTAQFIFLNHTCYNGLTRFNAKGEFNVPFGDYKHPRLYEEQHMQQWATLLQRTTIVCGDFAACQRYADAHTFVYCDPPYRPISKTASFTAYTQQHFDDAEQRRLAAFFRELDGMGAKLMLSNSDPQAQNPEDRFFDELYRGVRFERVMANRAINSNGSKRGEIPELVILNY